MIQEFYISVTPVGEEEYLVRTERVAPGVPLAEEQFTWHIDDWVLQTQQLMDDPLLSVLQSGAAPPSPNRPNQDVARQLQPGNTLPNLTLLGQQLYNALFQATIRDSWMTAQGIAYHRREALRLRLGVKGPRLPCLPWEVLHAGNRPIATGTDLVFSRYQPTFTPIALPLSLQQGQNRELGPEPGILKILMVISAPTDQASLELKQEVNHLQEELQQPVNGNGNGKVALPQIELTILDQPDREQLTQALEQGHYQVLHYAGHSNLAAAGGNLYLVNRKTGLSETLSGNDLAGLLVNNGIQMAVFNSCRGAYALTTEPGEDTRERSLAEALVKRGIPAVLAMAEKIPDDVALTLTRLLYRNLKQGHPVDLSLSRARQGLVSAYGSQQLYWALPILYLHPEFDGHLMPSDIPSELNGSPPTASLPISPAPVAHTATDDFTLVTPLTNHDSSADSQTSTTNGNGAGSSSHGVSANLNPPASSQPPLVDLIPATVLSKQDETELANLVDNLEYHDNLGSHTTSNGVSDLIRQLSYSSADEEGPAEDAFLFAPQSETLIPYEVESQTSPYLELPENPLYRTASLPSIDPETIKLQSFVSYHWQAKAFTRVRCIPFTEWRSVLVQRLDLEALFNPEPTRKNRPPKSTPHQTHNPRSQSPSFKETPITNHTSRQPSTSVRRLTPLLAVLAGATVTSLILGGGWLAWGWLSGRWTPPRLFSPSLTRPSGQSMNPPVSRDQQTALADQAIAHFQKGDLPAGQKVVETLLNQNALDEAARALGTVKEEPTDAGIKFLRGRLALQGVKAKRSQNSLSEAERFFKAATQVANSPLTYYNALVFTYYAGNRLNEANSLLIRNRCEGKLSREELTACAGQALVFMKSAEDSNLVAANKKGLQQQAIELRDQVMTQAPQEFQPDVLNSNWMWSQQAVEDWRSLLTLKP